MNLSNNQASRCGTLVTDGVTGMDFFRRDTIDQRTFSNEVETGFHRNSVHHDVGGGLRFFLRSVAVPLVGFDAG